MIIVLAPRIHRFKGLGMGNLQYWIRFCQKIHNTVTNHNYIWCVVRILLKQTLCCENAGAKKWECSLRKYFIPLCSVFLYWTNNLDIILYSPGVLYISEKGMLMNPWGIPRGVLRWLLKKSVISGNENRNSKL